MAVIHTFAVSNRAAQSLRERSADRETLAQFLELKPSWNSILLKALLGKALKGTQKDEQSVYHHCYCPVVNNGE